MKKIITIIILTGSFVFTLAQSPKKPAKPQEKPPTQKEMEMMYKNLTPEEKRIYDSMGIKLPTIKNMPKLTDKQFADAWSQEEKLFPVKNTALIAQLPKQVLENAAFAGYIKRISESIAIKISIGAKEMADKVLTQYKNDKNAGAMITAAANGMWMLGLKEQAVYLMANAIERMPNADNYNNFAAYLTMTGAAHIAIPILEKLNSIHKRNSTIYNNLAHAWLELGDEVKGEKYLDSTISIYMNHPQANFTKALLLEKKGKTNEAIIKLKNSLKHSVTKQKLTKLKQLEKKETSLENYQFPKRYFSATFNPVIYLDKFPAMYAMTAGVEIEKQWIAFREYLQMELKRVDEALIKNKSILEAEIKDVSKKSIRYGRPALSPHYMRSLATYRNNSLADVRLVSNKADLEIDANYLKEWAKLKTAFQRELSATLDSIERNEPANSPLLLNNCPAILPLVNKHIRLLNTLNKRYHEMKLKTWLSDAYQGYNYFMNTAMTEAVAMEGILTIRRNLLDKLLLLKHDSYDLADCIKEDKKNIPAVTGNLSDFDEVTCGSTSTLYVPLTGYIIIKCNRMDVIFNPAMIPVNFSFTSQYYGNNNVIKNASIGIKIKAADLNIAGTFDNNGNFKKGELSIGTNVKGISVKGTSEFTADGFKKTSIEMGIDGDLGLLPKSITEAAPIELGMKGELSAGVELTNEGFEDFNVNLKNELNMGASIEADIQKEGKEALKYTNEIVKEVSKNLALERRDKQGKLIETKIPTPALSSGANISADNRWSVNSGYNVERSSEFSWLKN